MIWRVERRETLQALRQMPRQRAGPLAVSWLPGDPAEPPRVAFAVGRPVGGAVVRNQLRRRLRMLMREAAPGLRPGAYMVSAGPGAVTLAYRDLRATLTNALARIESR